MLPNLIYCFVFVTLLTRLSGSYPQSFSPFFTQEDQQEQQQQEQQEQQQEQVDQAEVINENFYDEVRQLLDQKALENSDSVASIATAATLTTTTTTVSGVNSEERALDSTTLVSSDSFSTDTTSVQNVPKPRQISDWPKLDLRLGQVVAVSIGVDGHPVIFHRADRVWTDE